ncbi:hypothetical protein AB0K27_07795 [Micromonospora echinospora]|uniref:4Fe-4S ferredoxin-type domain-containing protein n=1 Tax=Micromonospora echinospora TaxID=1877 RepID=A0ABR6MAA4_MICEC|nr:hypothetical protein [Micromonospora echinospora]MBB5112308.1 hypothetical protein [Micromonospora echinospora]
MTEPQVQQILSVHVPGIDGFCAGCRAWWARLCPYPCQQVEWAARRQARTATRRFLDGLR